jgi:hypothetical protein
MAWSNKTTKKDPKDTLEALKIVIQQLETLNEALRFTNRDEEEKTLAEIMADLDWKLWELHNKYK